jgi:hypothetical protein
MDLDYTRTLTPARRLAPRRQTFRRRLGFSGEIAHQFYATKSRADLSVPHSVIDLGKLLCGLHESEVVGGGASAG